MDTADENLAFYMPSVIAVDGAGDLYVLDTGNHRVQKFGPDGTFKASYGRQGQGPGEFYYPSWLAVDEKGFLYVSDPNNKRIQVLTPDGKDHKTLKVLEQGAGPVFLGKGGSFVEGSPRMRFLVLTRTRKARGPAQAGQGPATARASSCASSANPRDFGDDLVNNGGQRGHSDGRRRRAGLSRLPRPEPDREIRGRRPPALAGRPRAPLLHGDQGEGQGRPAGRRQIVHPDAPDEPLRQRRRRRRQGPGLGRRHGPAAEEEEQVGTAVTMNMDSSGGRTIGYAGPGRRSELRTTDAYKLEVFDAEGVLLGSLPLDFFVDGIFIS
ncbi:MAG: NHL repeat-containing protein, partial [Sphingobacterium sp.]|nr:NHL repeat-containing protein [Sphingobacterium sp.]